MYEHGFVKLVQTFTEALDWITSETAASKHLKLVYNVHNKIKAVNVLYSLSIDLAKSRKNVMLEAQLMKCTNQ